jgi:plastocyanin
VNLPNEGAAPHNFSIDALGIDVDMAPGATEQVVINAPAGEYEFYCNVPGHKEAGMVGTLIVTEDAAAAAPAENGTAAATPAEASPAAATPAADGGEQAAAGEGTGEAVEVVSHDIFFEPDALSIPANTDVTVRLPNEGVTPHNFSIDELGIDVDIAPGATEETVINAPAGEYEYYCNVPGHKQAGMVGTLTVG